LHLPQFARWVAQWNFRIAGAPQANLPKDYPNNQIISFCNNSFAFFNHTHWLLSLLRVLEAVIVSPVGDVTQSLEAMRAGDGRAAEELLSLVYAELRRIAAVKMAGEAQGHTLQPTALVHEAWLKLAGNRSPAFDNRAHFFSCAAEAMRRILVESARRKQSLKRGERPDRVELAEWHAILSPPPDEALAVHEALDRLAAKDLVSAELVKLLYFAGLTMEEAAAALNVSKRTAEGRWTYARAWLRQVIAEGRD
jgi:RNA polymerase sigma factor (TIGR02999 family)